MGMRLLKKSEIDASKAAERKREIDDGAKLARRIDGLRQLSADEEAALEKHRVAMVTAIQHDIDEKTNERTSITTEVEKLRDEKKSLGVFLNEAWAQLHGERAQFERDKLDIVKDRDDVKQQRGLVDELEKFAREALAAAKSERELADGYIRDAEHTKEEAESAREDARKDRDDAARLRAETEAELEERRKEVRGRELIVAAAHQKNEADRAQLEIERKQLNDRIDTFARTINRKKL